LIIIIGLFFVFHSTMYQMNARTVFLPQSQQFATNDQGYSLSNNISDNSFNNLKEVSGGTATDAVSHDQAAIIYKDTHLVFDPNCRVIPVTLAIPPKTVVMLDNQSKWQRTIIVGPRTYIIQPYDYVLAAFNDTGAYGITCDSLQDVGFISVQ
jgi:hypothetical protein